MLQGFILVITAAAADLNILMNDGIVSVPGGLFSKGRNLKEEKNRKIALKKSVTMNDSLWMCSETQAWGFCVNEGCSPKPQCLAEEGFQRHGGVSLEELRPSPKSIITTLYHQPKLRDWMDITDKVIISIWHWGCREGGGKESKSFK